MNFYSKTKYIRNYILSILLINILLLLISFYIQKKNEKYFLFSPSVKQITIGKGNSMKIGIISDLQIITKTESDYPFIYDEYLSFFIRLKKTVTLNLQQTLNVLKKNKVDIIIIAGDITNDGESKSYELFTSIYESVFPKNYQGRPLLLTLMGNHDYIGFNKTSCQAIFYNKTKQFPYSHYIINDYHFILWSSDSENYFQDGGIEDISWIENELQNTNRNLKRENDPIFVITHVPPINTVYGSKFWGSEKIYKVFKKYHNIINFSGHSHNSLRNEKSIWQGDFTAINTQSISYIAADETFMNVMEIRQRSLDNSYMGIIADINNNKIEMNRIYFKTEEILDKKWIINFPINKDNFIYTDKIRKNNDSVDPPIFLDLNKGEKEFELIFKQRNIFWGDYIIFFDAAFHEDFVYMYKIVIIIINDNERLDNYNYSHFFDYYSDYYLIPEKRKKTVEITLPKLPNGKYKVEIYAVGTFGKKSEPKIGFIEINDTNKYIIKE